MVRAEQDQDGERFPFKMPLAAHGRELMEVPVEDSEAVTSRGEEWPAGTMGPIWGRDEGPTDAGTCHHQAVISNAL